MCTMMILNAVPMAETNDPGVYMAGAVIALFLLGYLVYHLKTMKKC